ncbi:obtusifoliol 14-alpha demethylase-like [Triticum urartu]|uniref:Obtusifoliol 14-alpha demethylase n=1 Tax=Triticum urartu TaxID=4572 RepID=A0A8R7UDB6_TRIUA|nr:obtusifoliol 14-alpha demethylase-like [Triticum urartu]
MDLTSSTAMWCAIVVLLVMLLATQKISRARRMSCIDPQCTSQQLPPVVNGVALLRLLPTLLKEGLPSMANDLYVKYGSVFTVSSFGLKVTLLIGPEVTVHFFQGLESDISHGNLLEFTVPMFGKAVGYGRDKATRIEQMRFHTEALKASGLRSHVHPMLQEVEGYFAKWGEEGIVDLKLEFEQLLMLISSRCLLGKEVRENMFDEVHALFHEIESSMTLISFLFPYLPTPVNRRRDRARIRLTQILSDVVESRKSSGRVEQDTLQKLIDSEYKDGNPTTVAEVVGLIMSLIFAGKRTSSLASTWTASCLLSHPVFLRAAIEEQQRVTKKYKGGLDYNAFSEMDTLHSCIKEALRMHPPAAMLVRRTHKPFTVEKKQGKQYEIPQDHIVATPTIVNNNIPYIYRDPHVYDPYRFGLERREDKVGGKFSYTSFSGGRHICVGEAYAYMQLKVIWSRLLRNFELELISPFPKTDWSKILPEPQGKLFIRYKRK